MQGGGRGYEWIGKVPWYWKILFYLSFAQFAVSWILLATISKWARSIPDSTHPVEFRMKFGHLYYLSPRLGWFMNNDLWIFFGLLGILFLILFIHRDRVRRAD
jgi:hypothetical protein